MKSLIKNNFKRILASVLALSLIFSIGITNIVSTAETLVATQTSAEWDGTIAENYADGTGAENDPYLIANGAQLAKLVNDTDTSGKYYKLTADIVLNDSLTDNPTQWYNVTGDDATDIQFKGTLDGDGHTVSGLYFSAAGNASWYGTGIIPRADSATVKNIGLVNSYMEITGTGTMCILGSIIGRGNKVTVSGCFADETVTINANQGRAGGIVALMTGASTIENCYFTGSVSGETACNPFYASGWTDNRNVKYCYTNSAVTKCGDTYYTRVYTTATGGGFEDATYGSVYVPALSAITGDNAATNLTDFDFTNTWQVMRNATPTLKAFYKRDGVWSGEIAENYADGTGAENDPYLIATAEQLAKLVNDTDTSGKYYKLTQNIVLNKALNSTAIQWYNVTGDDATDIQFKGTLDGNGHTVSGLYFSAAGNSGYYGTAIIPRANGATVKNIGLVNSNMTITGTGSNCFVASIIGRGNIVNVTGCFADETVTLNGNKGNAGGMVGVMTGASNILNCYFKGTLSATTADPFYATGWTNYRNVEFCYTTSAVSQKSNTYYEFVYTTATDGGFTGGTFGNVYSIALADITGDNAATNLTNFDFPDTWMTVANATPILTVFYNREKADKGIWTGLVAGSYTGGDGTAENPYQIANGEQLAKLAKDTETAGNYYVLTADIKLNDMESDDLIKWFTVYNSNVMFQGNFNGNGHTVSGLYYNATTITDGHRSGLFPVIGAGAVVTNISFESCDMSVGCYGGTVAGYSDVKADEVFPEISYINVEESVSIKGYTIGGVVGGGTIANFDNCCFTGTLTGVDMGENTAKRNGIVGNFWGVGDNIFYNISNCYTWKYAPFNYENVLAVCSNVYSGTTETVGGTIGGKTTENVKADAMNQLPNLNWKDVWAWEEGELPYLNLTEDGNYNSYEIGDTDCSNTVLNAADLVVIRKHLLGYDFAYNADLTKDGKVNIKDLVRLKKLLSVA